MSHIPEGDLVLYAAQPDAISQDRRTEIEAHLGSCAECQASYDFFAIRDDEVDELLGEPDTWEPMASSATHAALMEYGARVAEEDRDAEIILAPYLRNPIRAAWTTLVARRRFRTGGVVRKLNAAAHDVHKSRPLVALTFADTAISVAEVLPEQLYPALAVYQLRGAAWKERAKAQLLLGQFPQAHDSLDHAEHAYRKTTAQWPGLVRGGASSSGERAERGFAHAGDEKRRMDAAFLRASIMFEAGDPNRALPIFQRIIEHGENTQNAEWIALGSYAAGNCEVDRMNLGRRACCSTALSAPFASADRSVNGC